MTSPARGAMHPVVEPQTRFADLGGDKVAYQVLGTGPDLAFVTGTTSHVDLRWEEPLHARFLRRLASFSRLIPFDPRGTGASDPVAADQPLTWEDEAEDLRAVLDAVESQRAAVFASADAGPLAMIFAATHPERVSALVLANTTARFVASDDYPFAMSAAQVEDMMRRLGELWGTEDAAALAAPSKADDPEFRRWYARYQRAAARPRELSSYLPMAFTLDARSLLPSIRCPTLVLHRSADPFVGIEHGRYLARHIPGGRFVELPGADLLLPTEHADRILDVVEEFLTGSVTPPEIDRVL
ncbi:MAG: alpha/beta fold hydrolase, partial [Candidatus Binatia bacterium]